MKSPLPQAFVIGVIFQIKGVCTRIIKIKHAISFSKLPLYHPNKFYIQLVYFSIQGYYYQGLDS